MERTIKKLTKIALSFLMVITCINFSTVRAEDGETISDYSENTEVAMQSEDTQQEEEVVEEAAPVEETPVATETPTVEETTDAFTAEATPVVEDEVVATTEPESNDSADTNSVESTEEQQEEVEPSAEPKVVEPVATSEATDEEEPVVEKATPNSTAIAEQSSEEEIAVQEASTKSYNLYHYALIPGKEMDGTGSANQRWFGIGVTSVTGVDDPATLEVGTVVKNTNYTIGTASRNLYPNITYEGKTWQYAAPGSGNEDKEGYYTLQPARLVVSGGANDGNNHYNTTVDSNTHTYHLDYTMVMNEANYYTVSFKVQYPGENTFAALVENAQRVKSGTKESSIKLPTGDVLGDNKDALGNPYTFDGWYTDEACTKKANFKGTINGNTTYYAKYVAKTYTVNYDSRGGEEIKAKSIKYCDSIETPTITKTGYAFDGWYYNNQKVDNTTYDALVNNENTSAITLVAHWTGVLTVSANNYEGKYDGKQHDITVSVKQGDKSIEATVKFYNEETNAYDLDTCPTYKNAGNYTVKYQVSKKGFATITGEATIEITPRNVTLTSESDSKVYDGTALTKPEVAFDDDRFVDGEVSNICATGTITDVGSVTNTITYTTSDTFHIANYNITKNEGTLKITANNEAIVVTIKGNTSTVTYDGTEHEVSGYTVTSLNTKYDVSNVSYKGKTKVAKGTNADTYVLGLKAEDFANTNTNFSNVTFKVEDGALVINKRSVTLTSEGGSKVYDGTPLKKPKVTGGDGFVDGEVSDIRATGSQTEVGETTNTITYTTSDTFHIDNYSITKNEGKLIVTADENEVVVTITGHTGGEAYNGKQQTVEGYEVSITEGSKYTTKDFALKSGVEAKASGTNAGSYAMGLTADSFENKNKNYTKVTFVVTDGLLDIAKRKVTLTSASGEKTYDGTPLKKPEVKGGEGFVDGEVSNIKAISSITEVGKVSNVVSYMTNKNFNADNYDIKTTLGILKVNPVTEKVTVNIQENSGTYKYDGTEKRVTGYTVTSISNVLYKDTDFTFNGKAEVKGTDANTYDMDVKAADFKNTSKNFTNVEFEIADGKLTIAKRNVTLTSASDEKTYDGQPLTNATVTASGDGFANNEGATYNVTGSRTEVGSSKNTFTYTLYAGTKADNYTFELSEGELKVKPIEEEHVVTINGAKGSFTYDGQEHSVSGFTTDGTSGTDISVALKQGTTASVSRTKVGTSTMKLKADMFDVSSTNYTNIKVEVNNGSITITPKSIVPDTPETPEDEKTGISVDTLSDVKYNGTEQKQAPVVTDTKTDTTLVEGTDYELTYSEDVTNAGEVTVTITGIGNYTGTFTVKYNILKRDVTLTSESDSKVYDGIEFTKPDVIVSGDGFVDGEVRDIRATGSITNVGTVINTIVYETSEGFVENNYNISIDEGTLEVTEKSIVPDTPETPEDEKTGITASTPENVMYNGTEQKQSVVVTDTKTDTTLVEGTDYELTYSEDVTNAGEVTVTITGIGNYTGSFTRSYAITPRPVEITSTSDAKTYDGTALKKEETYVSSEIGFVDGEGYEASSFAEITEVGSIENTYEVTMQEGTLASNYEVTKKYGTLTINPINTVTVVITGNRDEVTYDGQSHSVEGYKTEISGDDGKYSVEDIAFTGSAKAEGTNAGTYNMQLSEEQFSNTNKNFANVIFTVNDGVLVINPANITVPENPEEDRFTVEKPEDSIYDGKEHVNKPVVKDGERVLTEGTDYELTYSEDVTNAGEVRVTITGIGNYTGSRETTYEITRRAVTLTSASDSKVYDGVEFTKPDVIVSGDGFVDGEVRDIRATGSITNVGTVINTIVYETSEGFVENNYNISIVEGTLEVTEKSIVPDTPETPEDEKTGINVDTLSDVKYNGTEQKQAPVVTDTKTDTTLVEGTDYELTYSEDVTNAGEVTVTITGIGNYTGTFTVKYNILKRDVTFTSASDSKVYDGSALTNHNVGVSGEGFVEGEGVAFVVNGSQIEVGSSDNTFTYVWNDGTNENNYTVTVVNGSLVVTQASVVPTETPDNGGNTPQTNPGIQTTTTSRAVTRTTTTSNPDSRVEDADTSTDEKVVEKLQDVETIEDESTPLAPRKGHWALVNLICALLTLVLAIFLLLAKHTKKEDEDSEKEEQIEATEEDEEVDEEAKRHRRWKVLGVVDALVAIVVFVLTENISLPMVLVDHWTILMVLFGLVGVVCFFFGRRWHEEDEDDTTEQNA